MKRDKKMGQIGTNSGMNWLCASTAAAVLLAGSVAGADEAKPAEPKRIEDNSFLLEEAYNQEPGVIQHIQTFQFNRDKTWNYSFTEEMPAGGRKHQLSATVPVQHLEGATPVSGLGDILFNYRYQLVDREEVAVSPRFSLILPTGSVAQGTGNGVPGYQVNLPLSVMLSPSWVTHWNLGTTLTPNLASGSGRVTALSFNYGMSVIWLAAEKFNLMVEFAGAANEKADGAGGITRENTFFVNPGARFAIDFDSGLQIVPGISVPIGVGPSAPQYGVFGYLSFEHSAWSGK